MDTKKWGKPMWDTLFCIAMNYPDKFDKNKKEHISIRKEYELFFHSLMYVLPCTYCRDSTINVISKAVPLDFSGNFELMLTLYLWKIMVNEKLDEQKRVRSKRKTLPFVKVYQKYYRCKANGRR